VRTSLSTEKCLEETMEPTSSLEVCPAFLALSLIANKWSIRILHALLQAESNRLRFNQIQKALHSITQRELTKQLREFEKSGLVERTVYPQVPPRVEYSLTPLGHSLWDPVERLSQWADEHAAEIAEKRAAYKG
jgi:DNA-binding HxlR family transcriptional regulator